MHIVLVEDDEVIRETTQLALERFGYTVTGFEDGRDGYEFVSRHGADAVLLDLMLPTMNGASITRAIRERSNVPIIVISARSEPIDIVQALEAGADDYLTKPFDMQVLNARIRTVVRRFINAESAQMGFSPQIPGTRAPRHAGRYGAGPGEDEVGDVTLDTRGIPEVLGPTPGHANPVPGESEPADVRVHNRLGTLTLDTARCMVKLNESEIHLTPTELRILMLLTEEVGHVYSREKIAYTVWGYEWGGDSRVVDVHIQRLRKKIGAGMIETVRGFGYRFSA